MRTFIFTAAAALLFTLPALAQQGAPDPAANPVKVSPAYGTEQATKLAEGKRAISSELKNTLGASSNLLMKAKEMTGSAEGVDQERIGKVAEAVSTIQQDLTQQLDLVGKATEADSEGIFATATEVNSGAIKSLEDLKMGLAPAEK